MIPRKPIQKNSGSEFDDDITITASNCSKDETKNRTTVETIEGMDIACNITRVINKPKLSEAIGDTGTTGHFIRPGAPVDNIKIATQPIEIEMPNGEIERSSHTCHLRIPNLLKELREAHIVPGLSHSSLISIKKLCRGGCEVIFKDDTCEVWYKTKLVLTGEAIGPGGLWILPIDERKSLDEPLQLNPTRIHPTLRRQRYIPCHTNSRR